MTYARTCRLRHREYDVQLMRMSEITFADAGALPIDSYGPGFFRVGGELINGPALVLPSVTTIWNGYHDIQALLDAAGQVDVVFIGTGAMVEHVPADFRRLLKNAGIASEAMPTRPACSTYNVLLSQGRCVGAALLPIF